MHIYRQVHGITSFVKHINKCTWICINIYKEVTQPHSKTASMHDMQKRLEDIK